MKRYISVFLLVMLLFSCVISNSPEAYAADKTNDSRAIAIVFDNSGSMYEQGNQAWCQATYAMEVFASMLNEGDVLQIYPMWPIIVGGNEYSMESPFQITDASQASLIRDIYTDNARGTPIESIDRALEGIQSLKADKKYVIVLTDGGTFTKNGNGLSRDRTRSELDKRVQANAGKALTFMYLGISADACMPNTEQSEYFVKKQAVNTADVLSSLTEMCNLIFGRDTLPKNRISGNTIEFDISMSKLIVFVQGEDISQLKLTGGSTGKLISSQQTQYSTKGAGDYKSNPDTSLQGMIVTYADCAAGKYNIEYAGTATSVEVYYEPDADLEFIFTDAAGNNVPINALYEGEYKVSFGMKDAKTGEMIHSDLLGNPHYEGSYYINGTETTIIYDGYSGEVPISLTVGDLFDVNMSVTYLSGYSIPKDSSDFGWPDGGISVLPRPAGDLRLEITGGDEYYSLENLEAGGPYIAKVYYQGTQLTGSELDSVELKWDPDTSNVEIMQEFSDDHYKLSLHYKDTIAPQDTVCGECTVSIYAFYTAHATEEAMTQTPLTYDVRDDSVAPQVELDIPTGYIVISDIESSDEIVARLTVKDAPLTPEEFAAIRMQVDCSGIEYELTADAQDSSYRIKLLPTNGIAEGDYDITATAFYVDRIGRESSAEDSASITLGKFPPWIKWVIYFLILLILAVLLWIILHIKVLPKHANTTRRLSSLVFDGDDVTQSTNFSAEIKQKGARAQTQYAGKKFGISMSVKPGKESFLYKPQKRRSAEVNVASVKKFGPAKITEVMIGSAKYVLDESGSKLVPALVNQKPFNLTNGMMIKYSGTITDAGVEKDFEATSKLNFKKK